MNTRDLVLLLTGLVLILVVPLVGFLFSRYQWKLGANLTTLVTLGFAIAGIGVFAIVRKVVVGVTK